MKTCYKCGETKPLTAFRKSGKNSDGSIKYKECRDCYREYIRGYMANRTREQRDRHNARKLEWKEQQRAEGKIPPRAAPKPNLSKTKKALMREAKAKPCMDCGISWPIQAMDLDHVRGTKNFGLSTAVYNQAQVRSGDNTKVPLFVSLEEFITELAKCDAVCSNCHRIRTYRRTGTLDYWDTPAL
jgi:hypothetical protein